jgi:hypothetical protein
MIRHLPHSPSTVNQLKAAVHKAWDNLTIEQITQYTGTMVDRVQAVKKARGGHTVKPVISHNPRWTPDAMTFWRL